MKFAVHAESKSQDIDDVSRIFDQTILDMKQVNSVVLATRFDPLCYVTNAGYLFYSNRSLYPFGGSGRPQLMSFTPA